MAAAAPTRRTFCVVLAKFPTQFIAALGNCPHAAPLAVAGFKYPVYKVLGNAIALVGNDARVLVLHFSPALFQLANRHQRPFQQIQRFESSDDNRHAEPC